MRFHVGVSHLGSSARLGGAEAPASVGIVPVQNVKIFDRIMSTITVKPLNQKIEVITVSNQIKVR